MSHHPGFPYLTVLILPAAAGALLAAVLPNASRVVYRLIGIVTSLAVLGFAIAVGFLLQAGTAATSSPRTTCGPSRSASRGTSASTDQPVPRPHGGGAVPDRARLRQVERDPRAFVGWMLLLEAACMGSFLSLDLILFFLFFELTLVPAYFIIAAGATPTGGTRRSSSSSTRSSGRLPAWHLGGRLLAQSQTGGSPLAAALEHTTSADDRILLFWRFTSAFANQGRRCSRSHLSPDAYAEAPTGGFDDSPGVLAKLGTYGIIRFTSTCSPGSRTLAPLLLTLAVIGILYGAVSPCPAGHEATHRLLVARPDRLHPLGTFAFTTQACPAACCSWSITPDHRRAVPASGGLRGRHTWR